MSESDDLASHVLDQIITLPDGDKIRLRDFSIEEIQRMFAEQNSPRKANKPDAAATDDDLNMDTGAPTNLSEFPFLPVKSRNSKRSGAEINSTPSTSSAKVPKLNTSPPPPTY